MVANASVVPRVSRLLDESPIEGLDFANVTKGQDSKIREEEGKVPNVVYALLPLEDLKFIAKGNKMPEIKMNKPKKYFLH